VLLYTQSHVYRLRKRKIEEEIAPQKKEFKKKNQERETR
jgi:hypothetical protein